MRRETIDDDAIEATGENAHGEGRLGRLSVHVTAANAYPAFERLVLSARHEIVAGFRIFDMSTRLRTPEARRVGADWFDLILHKIREGVSFRLVVSDFDAVVATELHGLTWRTVRQGAALVELAPDDAPIQVIPSLHPAEVGWAARVALWPRVDRLLRDKASGLLELDAPKRKRFLQRHPHLSRFLMVNADDRPGPRRWPLPPLAPVTHHQKCAVIDGERLYIGGLDLNERRWDTPAHDRAASETWHDVQLSVEDRASAQAARTHLLEFTKVIRLEAEPSRLEGPVLRTLSAKRRRGPLALSPKEKVSEINDAILDGIGSAERLIYIETQFLRDRRVAKELAQAARRVPDLELVLMVPARPEDVAFERSNREDARFGEYLQARCIRRVRRAFRGRVFIGSPVRPVTAMGQGLDVLHGAPLIYLHSKVATFDDGLAVVGSANLNGRSLQWDTELAWATAVPDEVRLVRRTCMSAILGKGVMTEAHERPGAAARTWQVMALANARAKPEERTGFVVPHLSRPARLFGRDLGPVPEEIV